MFVFLNGAWYAIEHIISLRKIVIDFNKPKYGLLMTLSTGEKIELFEGSAGETQLELDRVMAIIRGE